MRRREFVTLVGGAVAALPRIALGHQQSGIKRIGVLSQGSIHNHPTPEFREFLKRLRELGWTENQNFLIEWRFSEGSAVPLAQLATELVEKNVDVIVAFSTPAARAAKQATTAIPIVAIAMADPVEDELVATLARPGGNVTGTAFLGPELVSRRLQLLKELVPRLSRAAVLWHPCAYGERTMAGMLKEIESAAQTLETKLQFVAVAGPDDLEPAFSAMVKERADGLIVFPSPILFGQYPRIVALAANNRLPAIYAAREGVELGGLDSYGVNLDDLSRATAIYLEKILKGAKPAELPVQRAAKFELAINLKTAKALGLTVTRDFLLIADEVIE